MMPEAACVLVCIIFPSPPFLTAPNCRQQASMCIGSSRCLADCGGPAAPFLPYQVARMGGKNGVGGAPPNTRWGYEKGRHPQQLQLDDLQKYSTLKGLT